MYIYIYIMYVLLINGTRRTYVKSLSPVLAYASKWFSMVVNTVGILNNIVDNYKLDYHSSHRKNGNMFMLNMHGYSLLVLTIH